MCSECPLTTHPSGTFFSPLRSEGCKSVAAGMNPMDLKRGAQLAVDKIVKTLEALSKKITTKEEIAQVRRPRAPHIALSPILTSPLSRRPGSPIKSISYPYLTHIRPAIHPLI